MESESIKKTKGKARRDKKKAKFKERKVLVTGLTGIVDRYFPRAGYGFIVRDDNQGEITVKSCDILRNCSYRSMPSLGEGELVEFDVVVENKKIKAINVTGPNGTEVRGSQFVSYTKASECGIRDISFIARELDRSDIIGIEIGELNDGLNHRLHTKEQLDSGNDFCLVNPDCNSQKFVVASTQQNGALLEKETVAELPTETNPRCKKHRKPPILEGLAVEDEIEKEAEDNPSGISQQQSVQQNCPTHLLHGNEARTEATEEPLQETLLNATYQEIANPNATEEEIASNLFVQPPEPPANLEFNGKLPPNLIDLNSEAKLAIDSLETKESAIDELIQTTAVSLSSVNAAADTVLSLPVKPIASSPREEILSNEPKEIEVVAATKPNAQAEDTLTDYPEEPELIFAHLPDEITIVVKKNTGKIVISIFGETKKKNVKNNGPSGPDAEHLKDNVKGISTGSGRWKKVFSGIGFSKIFNFLKH